MNFALQSSTRSRSPGVHELSAQRTTAKAGQPGVPPRWLPAPRHRRLRHFQLPANLHGGAAYVHVSPGRNGFGSFLSGRTFTEVLAGLAVLPGPLRGLLHDLDLHQAGYRASADGPFLDMALYDRFQRLEDIRDLPPRQLRLLRDIRKQLRFRHRLGEVLDSCQHSLLEMSEPRLVLRPRMIPDQADPTPLGCDSGYAAKRARPASAGQAAPLGVLVTVTRAPKFDGRCLTEAAPDALDCRAAAPSTFGREHLVGLDGQSSVSAAGLLRLDRPLPPTRQSWTAPAPSGRRTVVGLEWNPLDALGRALSASNDGPFTAPGKTHECHSKGNRRPPK